MVEHHECKAGHDFNGDLRDCEAKIIFGKCENCDEWVAHIKNAKESREEYRKDTDLFPPKKSLFVSADMQKVVMLPRLLGLKTPVFTRRITMYHETFAPLVPTKKVQQLWRKEGKIMKK